MIKIFKTIKESLNLDIKLNKENIKKLNEVNHSGLTIHDNLKWNNKETSGI